ncbi:MAG: AAA family ATPase [Alkaliphilus sp.]|nr:AAA family ATPase [Alkaliphilus sp.]
MVSIKIKLLGTPSVKINDEPVAFPFRKAEALFYYMAVKKQVSRDELVSLLWSEMDEENAKKNLRHAMYKLRKTFGLDIIISPQKSNVILNPDIAMEVDLDIFLHDPTRDIEVYSGEFLQGFYVKEGEQFEEWMLQYRDYLKYSFSNKLYERIEEGISPVEKYGKLLIAEDPFDERAYRTLMKIYARERAYSKVISTYHKLSETLDKELGIGPDGETKALYDEIMGNRGLESQRNKASDEFFYGRNQELLKMKQNYDNFIDDYASKSMLIVGEAGIGKTRLKDQFIHKLSKDNVFLLESNCYQAEEEFFLKPWNDIFEKLYEIIINENIKIPLLWKNVISYMFPIFGKVSNIANINPVERIDALKYQVAEEAIIGVFKNVSRKRKIIIIFEDIQWMDHMSLTLLKSILLRQQRNDTLLIATCRNGYGDKLDKFIPVLVKYDGLEKIYIDRFSEIEVEEFSRKALPHYAWTHDVLDKIFEETEGNAFFLVEVINAIKEKGDIGEMTSKMQDIIKGRFFGLSEKGLKLINIASLFFDKVSLDLLKTLSEKDEMEILDIMEELQGRYLLREHVDGEQISYEFTHQKLREYVYLQQSFARKRILHNRIGQILEGTLRNNQGDRFIYPKLIYHFKNAANHTAALKYLIKNLDLYFDFCHEMFPVIGDEKLEIEKYAYFSDGEAARQFQEIENLFEKINSEEKLATHFKSLEITFHHMKGRYLIHEGEYKDGIVYIQRMIAGALTMNDYEYALKGYRQMIYYCIQVHNIRCMEEFVELGIKLAMSKNHQKEMGILLRLKGLHRIMCGLFDEAEEILKQSIGIFQALNQHDDRYSLNIAAGYNYIGEIRRYNMKFSSALEYYDKAMAICAEKNVLRGLTVFNTNAGQAALDMGDYHRAKNYFQKALQLYNQLDTLWGRSTAEGYMSLLMINDGSYEESFEHLLKADEYANKLQSPYELGLVYRVKAEIKAGMKKNKRVSQVFGEYLNLDLEEYCNRGIELLKELKESYEAEILKVLKKNRG